MEPPPQPPYSPLSISSDLDPTQQSRGTQTEQRDTLSPEFHYPSGSTPGQALFLEPLPHPPIIQESILKERLGDDLIPDTSRGSIPATHLETVMARNSRASQSSSNRPLQYHLLTPGSNNDPRAMSQNNKYQLIHSLRTHRVNTITELRRIEKIFAYLDSSEVTEPMTAAWAHYVNSNNLLNELRGLTRSYPFSSECLDEAKALVIRDPQSVRSWNYCWLVLLKMEKEGLITKHARALASKPAMWGGRTPTAEGVQLLANACIAEWTRALRQMLRHWDRPPSTTGN